MALGTASTAALRFRAHSAPIACSLPGVNFSPVRRQFVDSEAIDRNAAECAPRSSRRAPGAAGAGRASPASRAIDSLPCRPWASLGESTARRRAARPLRKGRIVRSQPSSSARHSALGRYANTPCSMRSRVSSTVSAPISVLRRFSGALPPSAAFGDLSPSSAASRQRFHWRDPQPEPDAGACAARPAQSRFMPVGIHCGPQ
jgi:hypothetical protein